MLIQFDEYLTFENIYLWINFGVLPFWLMIILIPNSRIAQIFINSVILPLLLSIAYVYVFYHAILLEGSFLDFFKSYSSLENLYMLFANESFLLIFWIHFVSLNLSILIVIPLSF